MLSSSKTTTTQQPLHSLRMHACASEVTLFLRNHVTGEFMQTPPLPRLPWYKSDHLWLLSSGDQS